MSKNIYMICILFVLCLTVAFSGSHYWDHGEIVRGQKINLALDEKMQVSGGAFIQLAPQAAFATTSAAVGTIYKNSAGALNHLSTGTTWVTLTATTTGLAW